MTLEGSSWPLQEYTIVDGEEVDAVGDGTEQAAYGCPRSMSTLPHNHFDTTPQRCSSERASSSVIGEATGSS